MLGKIAGRRRVWQRWGSWMASLPQWPRVWANSRRQWRTGKPGVLQSMRSQRVRHDWVTVTFEEMQGLGSRKQFLNISNFLKTCSTSFPGAQSASSPPWTPFRACRGSTSGAAQGSISTEADGKCPWQAPVCNWQGHPLDHCSRGLSSHYHFVPPAWTFFNFLGHKQSSSCPRVFAFVP